jgi:hypothetical protein
MYDMTTPLRYPNDPSSEIDSEGRAVERANTPDEVHPDQGTLFDVDDAGNAINTGEADAYTSGPKGRCEGDNA